MADPIPTCELRRDARSFRALKKKGLSDDQKRRLFAIAHQSYRFYQRRLLELATEAGIRTTIWAKDRVEVEPGLEDEDGAR